MTLNNILVTGAGGQLGQEIQAISKNYPNFNFIFATKEELDITSKETVRGFVLINKIDYCINAAAYTQVDKAESEKELSNLINDEAVGLLSSALASTEATLIHISTDYVYDNDLRRPLLETDPLNPQGQYAKTKLDGELKAHKNNPKAIVLRTSWVFSSFSNNFVKTMIKLLSSRDEISVVNDQIGCPTYARDLASSILEIITQLTQAELIDPIIYRTYNYCNRGPCSWYDFAQKINDSTGLNKTIHAIPSIDYPTPAPRPTYSVMDTSLIEEVFGLEIRDWKAPLQECLILLLN